MSCEPERILLIKLYGIIFLSFRENKDFFPQAVGTWFCLLVRMEGMFGSQTAADFFRALSVQPAALVFFSPLDHLSTYDFIFRHTLLPMLFLSYLGTMCIIINLILFINSLFKTLFAS